MFCPACRTEYQADWVACPKDATHLLKSAQIGKYTIDALLGTGGMGAVYRASNPDTRGRVAIKVMNPSVASSESARARFQREAAAVAALNTTHVVKVYDFGTEPDGTLYLVMELLDGHPLRSEIVPPPATMDLARVQLVLEGALKGLAAAHKAGIIHRDLKPDNIFVSQTDDGEVPKLVDFGIARVRSADSDLTRTGTLVGTASYMAPEQIAAGMGTIGTWSDVYAMGAILYEMLSGTAAFGGDTITGVLSRVLQADKPALRDVRGGLPEDIYQLVDRCMAADPAQRPQDAEAMRRELVGARLVAPGTPVPVARVAVKQSTAAELARTETPVDVTPPPKPKPEPMSTPTVPITGPNYPAALPPAVATAPSRRSRAPFAIAGVVLVGGAIAFAVTRGGGGTPPAIDAGTVATRATDAAIAVPPAIDAAIAIDAAVDPRAATMVLVDHLWIDRHEVTKGELAAVAKTSPKAAADPDTAPARFVDAATAAAACKALGKRLPTQAEWDAAADTTPKDVKRAKLKRTGTIADLTSADATDCSPAGLCDMLGGVLEWTTTSKPGSRERLVMGASYTFDPDDPQIVISIHNATPVDPRSQDNEIGFRCVASKGP